jgi:hypothetical protein
MDKPAEEGGAAVNPFTSSNSMHYGDLIYLNVESVDGYMQSSG